MPDPVPKKTKVWELVAVFALGGAAGFYISRMFGGAQATTGRLATGNQHWHSNKLQITAPGYAGDDTTDAAAMAELEQQLEQPEPY